MSANEMIADASAGRARIPHALRRLLIYDRSDKEAEAACIGTLSRARLASDVEIANAFGVHRNTVGRISARFAREGMAAVVPAKRGPKGPSKVTDAALSVIASNVGMPVKQLQEKVASERVVVSVPHLYRLVRPYRPGQAAFFREAPGDVDDAGGPAPEDLGTWCDSTAPWTPGRGRLSSATAAPLPTASRCQPGGNPNTST
jgi:hypothetical protein